MVWFSPGGESTTFLKHLERAGFYDVLNEFVHAKPVFGNLRRLHSAGAYGFQPAAGELRSSAGDCRAERLRPAERLGHSPRRDHPSRRSAGGGVHPRATPE